MKLPLLAAALVLAGCQAPVLNADGLPPATQTGADTGGFLLDGKPFVADLKVEKRRVRADSYRIAGQPVTRKIVINLGQPGTDKDAAYYTRGLKVLLDSVTGPGVYGTTPRLQPIYANIAGSRLLYVMLSDRQSRYYSTGPTAAGRITITRLDTVAHIIAGTFEAELLETEAPATHRLSDGRFDCIYTEGLSEGTSSQRPK